jgi:ferredoxin
VALADRHRYRRLASLSSPTRHPRTDRIGEVKVQINSERCQRHGRCYDLAAGLLGDDDQGFGQAIGDGVVPPGNEREARLAASSES